MIHRDQPRNIIDAASRGAEQGIPIVFVVVGMMIAFVSIQHLINAVFTYLGDLVYIENLTIEVNDNVKGITVE